MKNVTTKEKALIIEIMNGMQDGLDAGYSEYQVNQSTRNNGIDAETKGVLGNLVKKGLVYDSYEGLEVNGQVIAMYCVNQTPETEAIAAEIGLSFDNQPEPEETPEPDSIRVEKQSVTIENGVCKIMLVIRRLNDRASTRMDDEFNLKHAGTASYMTRTEAFSKADYVLRRMYETFEYGTSNELSEQYNEAYSNYNAALKQKAEFIQQLCDLGMDVDEEDIEKLTLISAAEICWLDEMEQLDWRLNQIETSES